MQLYYPVKNTINPTNPFGTQSKRYSDLGLKGHQGVDFESPSGTKLYAPCDGLAMYVTDQFHGDGLWIYNTSDGENHIVILYHLYPKGDPQFPFQVPTDGSKTLVKAGDFLAYTDNSGAPVESNGSHLHVGVIPCDPDFNPLDENNGYHGCVDPMPFFNGKYAEDISIAAQAIPLASQVINLDEKSTIPPAMKISLLKKVAQFLADLLNKI